MSSLPASISFLRQSPDNFLVITNQETDTRIGGDKVFITDVPGGDLEAFIKTNLGQTTTDTNVWIEHRKIIGTSNRKAENQPSYRILVKATAPAPTPQPALPAEVNHPVTPSYPVTHHAPVPGLHQPSFMGLGFQEAVQLMTDKERLQDAKEKIADLKEEIADLKAENRSLTIEVRELKSQVAVAEQKKDMAVMLAESQNRSLFETPAFEKLVENAPQIFAMMAQRGASNVPAGLGASQEDNLPEPIQEVVDYIAENCNVQQAQFIGGVLHFIDNPDFLNDLRQLMENYSAHEGNNNSN